MEAVLYDVCVIGSGVNGSSAAYSLAKQSKKVLLLEQFPIPHNRGSSHGQTRVVRSLYKQYDYAKMSGDSFPLWEKLEEEANENLLILNGNMQFYGPSHYDELKEFCASIDKINAKYEVVESGNEFNKRYPLFNIPEDTKTIIEPGGGTILASKAVLALQNICIKPWGIKRWRESDKDCTGRYHSNQNRSINLQRKIYHYRMRTLHEDFNRRFRLTFTFTGRPYSLFVLHR